MNSTQLRLAGAIVTVAIFASIECFAATVTPGNIHLSGIASGPGGTYVTGDTLSISWDNSFTGDNNLDITLASQVEFDLSEIGGSATQTPNVAFDVFFFDWLIPPGPSIIDAHVTVTATPPSGASSSAQSPTINPSSVPEPATLTLLLGGLGVLGVGIRRRS